MVIKKEVISYQDLKKILEGLGCYFPNHGDFFYRGVPDDKFELLPPLFYPPAPANGRAKEKLVLDQFISKTSFWEDVDPVQRVWRNAFYSRHWGLQSRMIDWTIDLSVALYFMLQKGKSDSTAALFILPKYNVHFQTEIPDVSYYDYSETSMLNPSFKLDDQALTASKNRFFQNGRFLIQDYSIAGECFYERNKNIVSKILIPQRNLRRIYEELCDNKGIYPDYPLTVNTDSDGLYKFCEELNNRKI